MLQAALTAAGKPRAKPRVMAQGEERKRGPAGRTSMYKVPPLPLLPKEAPAACQHAHALPRAVRWLWAAAQHLCMPACACAAARCQMAVGGAAAFLLLVVLAYCKQHHLLSCVVQARVAGMGGFPVPTDSCLLPTGTLLQFQGTKPVGQRRASGVCCAHSSFTCSWGETLGAARRA